MLKEQEFYRRVESGISEMIRDAGYEGTVHVDRITKNNGLVLTGLSVIKEHECSAPVLYLEEYYRKYSDGSAFEDVLNEIASQYVSFLQSFPPPEVPDLNYESVKDMIVFVLVNEELNRPRLAELVHRSLGNGFAFIYCISAGEGMRLFINNAVLSELKCTEQQLYERAMVNTPEQNPSVFCELNPAMAHGKPADNLLRSVELPVLRCSADGVWHWDHRSGRKNADSIAAPLFLLTNTDGCEGSSVLEYPGVKEKVSKLMDGRYFIIPSSVHELIIVPVCSDIHLDFLQGILLDINHRYVRPQDLLGSRIYVYEPDLNRVIPADECADLRS